MQDYGQSRLERCMSQSKAEIQFFLKIEATCIYVVGEQRFSVRIDFIFRCFHFRKHTSSASRCCFKDGDEAASF